MKAFLHLLVFLCGVQQLAAQISAIEPKAKAAVLTAAADSVVTPRPRTSAVAIAQYKAGEVYMRAVYGQPLRRGREIFGVLQPYGQLWRTGANEATEVTFTRDVRFGGKLLRAGTYTLFTVPDSTKWTVICNGDLGQWGAFGYNAAKNVLTVDVAPTTTREIYEAFTIRFDETKTGADMVLLWDKTRVAVPITFEKQ